MSDPHDISQTDWSPERKVVGGAVAVLVLAILQVVTDVEIAPGVEGALTVLTAYFLPNKK